MEIVIAKEAGFCFGVKRALDLAYSNTGDNVYSLGPLIHNPQVVKELAKKGIKKVDSVSEIPIKSRVIIRSHGVGPKNFEEAQEKNIEIIDGTCPFVRSAQKIAKKLSDDGFTVVIVGDKEHPEVQGVKKWAKEVHVVADLKEAQDICDLEKVGVLAQTTLPEKVFLEVVEYLKTKCDTLNVHNSICHATRLRQEAAVELAPAVDVMIVIGGRNSSNTKKLVLLCRQTGTPTFHIESAEELELKMFKGVKRAGVTAGASTPNSIIEEVVLRMTEMNDKQNEELQQEEVEKVSGEEVNKEQPEAEKPKTKKPKTKKAKKAEEDKTTETTPEEDKAAETTPKEEEAEKEADALMQATEIPPANFQKGDIIEGKIIKISNDEAMVDVGGKSEGIIPKGEIISFDEIKVGEKVELFVIKPENEEGNPILSKRRADKIKIWQGLKDAFEANREIKGKVVEVVKGGILVDVGIRGFVPASLVERGYVENLDNYLEKELTMKIIELDKAKNKLVLSQKLVLDEEHDELVKQTWEQIDVGQTKNGIVRRIADFGAFVDIGGIDGLLHVSELSWGRINHPKDMLAEGQEIEVIILGIDKDAQKISLGLKQLKENPWKSADKKYPVGVIVKGKVLRIAPFGAFLEVEPGIEGLVHISQISDEHIEKTEDALKVGDELEVKVLSIDSKAQRISLSIKDVNPQKQETTNKENFKKEAKAEEEGSGVTIGDLYGDLLRKNGKED